jgi:hypothetical protein
MNTHSSKPTHDRNRDASHLSDRHTQTSCSCPLKPTGLRTLQRLVSGWLPPPLTPATNNSRRGQGERAGLPYRTCGVWCMRRRLSVPGRIFRQRQTSTMCTSAVSAEYWVSDQGMARHQDVKKDLTKSLNRKRRDCLPAFARLPLNSRCTMP